MPEQDNSMIGKICIVTGATSGIGEATSLALARRGASVIGVARNPERCAASVERIQQATGNPAVEFMVADLSSQAQIRRLAHEFRSKYSHLDVLVNNAGAVFIWRKVNEDGIEMTFALNHLSYFLLTNLLLDILKASAPSRIVNVSSNSHFGAPIDFDDLQYTRGYWFMRAYGRSKFANVLFTYELSRRLMGTGVTATALHPGFVATNIGKNNGWLVRLFAPLWQYGALSPEEGARTNDYLASSPEVEGVTGKYFINQKQVSSDPGTYDQAAAQRLWQISAEMTGLESHV